MRPSLDFRCGKISYILTTCPYFNNLEFAFLTQVAFNAISLRLSPFQLGYERFQYISLH